MGRVESEQRLEFLIPAIPRAKRRAHTTFTENGFKNLARMITRTAIRYNDWVCNSDPVYIALSVRVGYNLNSNNESKLAQREGREFSTRPPTVVSVVDVLLELWRGLVFKNPINIIGITVVRQFSEEEGIDVLIGKPKDWGELKNDLRNA